MNEIRLGIKMNEIRLDIPRCAPGLNKIKDLHWSKFKEQRDLWSREIMVAYNEIGEPDIEEPVEIMYRRAYNGRHMDWDNLAASAKFAIDGLEDHVITDDSPDTIKGLELDQFSVHKDEYPLTQIIIREVEE